MFEYLLLYTVYNKKIFNLRNRGRSVHPTSLENCCQGRHRLFFRVLEVLGGSRDHAHTLSRNGWPQRNRGSCRSCSACGQGRYVWKRTVTKRKEVKEVLKNTSVPKRKQFEHKKVGKEVKTTVEKDFCTKKKSF